MRNHSFQFTAVLVAGFIGLCATSDAMGGRVVRKGAAEVIEHLTRKGGTKAARELVEFGGRQAVEEVLEKAMREGGEEMVERVARHARRHGVGALRGNAARLLSERNDLSEANQKLGDHLAQASSQLDAERTTVQELREEIGRLGSELAEERRGGLSGVGRALRRLLGL